MPRQSRRARAQQAARGRLEPSAPRHPHLRTAPLVVDPQPSREPSKEDALEPGYGATQAVVEQPVVARAEERRFTAPPASAANPFRRPSAAATARQTVSATASRLATTDYGYVIGELKRIFITAGVIILLLIVVALVKH